MALPSGKLARLWIEKNGHICYQVTSPDMCCPCAHGAPESECDCFDEKRMKGKKTYWPEHEGWNPPGPKYF